MAKILAIETSCDETAAAVVVDRSHVLSSIIASQHDIHEKYGGIVPELASRRHLECIGPVVTEALLQSGTAREDLDAIAVTCGPGLVGPLLVGLCVAKAMAWQLEVPLIAVNHLEGHVRSPFIENPGIELPAIALVVSGGHTALYLCPEEGVYRQISRTRDDAAGEAFDKVARFLGLPYPGGPVIDRISEGANENAIDFPRASMKNQSLDFSFSGLKTAARIRATNDGLAHGNSADAEASPAVRDLVASLQRTIAETLLETTLKACRREGVSTVLLAGGVACNRRLRRAFDDAAKRHGLAVFMPSPRYTTDNAAMIGAAAFLQFERGAFAPLEVNADPNWKLGA